MTMPLYIKRISDLFDCNGQHQMLRTIRCVAIDAHFLRHRFADEAYMDAATILLITRGSLAHEINRHPTQGGVGSLSVISPSHLFRVTTCTDDCCAVCLMVGEEFMHNMDSVDMIYKRIRYGVKLYAQPVVELTSQEVSTIERRLFSLSNAIDNTSHLYYKEVILNRLFAFYLDLSDIIDRAEGFAPSEQSNRHESIVKRFVELLTAHYRAEHKVEFYAKRLNLSTHYLTLIVKEVTGRSVSDFIYWMLYSDARSLLNDSKLSVQQITTLLHFSDQSAFGKFFKRRSSLSPLDYRKKQL